jgi:hypothetical protein
MPPLLPTLHKEWPSHTYSNSKKVGYNERKIGNNILMEGESIIEKKSIQPPQKKRTREIRKANEIHHYLSQY